MGIRKILTFILIVAMFFCSYIYLSNKYNPSAIEFYASSNVKYEEMQRIKKKNSIEKCSLNYKMPFLDDLLIMTTGLDTQFSKIETINSSMVFDLNRNVAVIGDKVADKYFRSEDAVGRKIRVFEEEYEIIGIIKKSQSIYIPYDPELLTQNWKKIIFRFETESGRVPYLLIEKVQNDLKTLGIEIHHTVINRVKIYSYIDIIILLVLYVLARMIKKHYLLVKASIISLRNNYEIQKRGIEWYKYLLDRKRDIIKIFKNILAVILFGYLALQSIKHMELSQVIIPDNLFSLNSYIDMFKRIYSILLYQLQYGFSDISIDIIFLNTSLIIVVAYLAFKTLKETQS